ncbi:MAG: MarR family winged helix-turn-helix transcriptional regulator [Acidimicrobiales bacterium]
MAPAHPLPFDPIREARRHWQAHGWDAAAGGMAAVTSVFRAQQIYLSRVDSALRPFGLTFARYEVLMLLMFAREGSLPLNKVGTRLQVHPTSITNAVDRLEEHGLIRRVPHPTDRRTTLAEILPAGRRVAEKATAAINDEVFSSPGIGASDVEALIAVLEQLRSGAGDFEPPPPSGGSRVAAGPATRPRGS